MTARWPTFDLVIHRRSLSERQSALHPATAQGGLGAPLTAQSGVTRKECSVGDLAPESDLICAARTGLHCTKYSAWARSSAKHTRGGLQLVYTEAALKGSLASVSTWAAAAPS